MAKVGKFDSGLEFDNNSRLEKSGVKFWYNDGACKIKWNKPIRKASCLDCGGGDVASLHDYTADFAFISKSGKLIIIECKGHYLAWTGSTRSKHQLIKKQYPDMDLRFVFNNKHAKISSRSKTTNSEWCKRQKFQCASGLIPYEWINE